MPSRAAYLELQDRALRHGTAVSRFSAGLAQRQQQRLRRALDWSLSDRVAAAIARVRSRGPQVGPHTRVGLRERLQGFDRDLRDVVEDIDRDTRVELRGLADEEGDHEAAILLGLFGAGVRTASRAALRRPVLAAAHAGQRLRDHLRDWEGNVRRGLRREITQGLANGESTDGIVRRVTGSGTTRGLFDRATDSLGSRIETVSTGVAAQAREEVYKASPAVHRVLWIATLDGRTCPRCAALHGQRFAVGEGPRPPLHQNCRCQTTPAGSGTDVVAIDFDAWLRTQPVATQKDILGETRARLFREDRIRLSRFVSGNRVLTLDELKARGIETDPFPNTPIIVR